MKLNNVCLAVYQTTAPSTTTLNRVATARAVQAAKASKEAARLYNTVLKSKGTAIGKAVSLQNLTGQKIRRYGLPCPAGGLYVRRDDVRRVQDIFDDAQIEMDRIRGEIVLTYDECVADIKAALGDFANEVYIPTASTAASRFTMQLTWLAAPGALDNRFLKGLSTELANRLRAESESRAEDMLREAHAAPVRDLRDRLLTLTEKLTQAERFHPSQVDHVRAEARRLRALNVLGIDQLNQLVDEVNSAFGEVTEVDKSQRSALATEANRISNKAKETLAALGL